MMKKKTEKRNKFMEGVAINLIISLVFFIGFDILNSIFEWGLSWWECWALSFIVMICVDEFNPHGKIWRSYE